MRMKQMINWSGKSVKSASLFYICKFILETHCMPSISHKAAEMPASPIRKLVPFAEAAKKRGTKIYHLNIGQPDIETPVSFLNAIKNTDLKIVEYSHSAGNESYRKKLCTYYKEYNIVHLMSWPLCDEASFRFLVFKLGFSGFSIKT